MKMFESAGAIVWSLNWIYLKRHFPYLLLRIDTLRHGFLPRRSRFLSYITIIWTFRCSILKRKCHLFLTDLDWSNICLIALRIIFFIFLCCLILIQFSLYSKQDQSPIFYIRIYCLPSSCPIWKRAILYILVFKITVVDALFFWGQSIF